MTPTLAGGPFRLDSLLYGEAFQCARGEGELSLRQALEGPEERTLPGVSHSQFPGLCQRSGDPRSPKQLYTRSRYRASFPSTPFVRVLLIRASSVPFVSFRLTRVLSVGPSIVSRRKGSHSFCGDAENPRRCILQPERASRGPRRVTVLQPAHAGTLRAPCLSPFWGTVALTWHLLVPSVCENATARTLHARQGRKVKRALEEAG